MISTHVSIPAINDVFCALISIVNSGSVEEGGRNLAQPMVDTWTECGKQL